MKNTSGKIKRKKYAVGTSITNYIEDPSTALAQNDINWAKAQAETTSNPWLQAGKFIGNTAMQVGGSMLAGQLSGAGGDALTKGGIDKNLVGAISKLLPTAVGTASQFATGGNVMDGLDEQTIAKLQQMADSQGITLEELIANLQNHSQESSDDLALDTNEFASGGTIHIKTANKGKFNATKARTGKTTEELTHSSNPVTRKRAIFAQNASHWKHADGGTVQNGVPVEVEGDEVGETPQGQLLDFQGPSHEQGGIDATLPEGTEIYSKRIAIDGETMADRKKKRESIVARYSKKADKGGAIEKNTLNRILFATEQEEAKDTQIQQAIHNALTAQGKSLVKNDGEREKHAGGNLVGLSSKNSTPENWNPITNSFESIMGTNSDNPTDIIPRPNVIYPKAVSDKLKTPQDYINEFSNTDKYFPATGNPNKFIDTSNLNKEVPTSDTQESKNPGSSIDIWKSVKDALPLTGGDALNMAGNIFQGVAPYINNLNQRATDTPNVNQFKDYGKEGLDKMSQTENFHKQVLDDALLNLENNRRSATSLGRRSAKGVNTMRALDLAAEENADNQSRNLYDSYASRMAQTMAQEAGMENQQDQVVMGGAREADIANRQDKDAFYTANGELLRNLGMTGAETGKQLNQALARENTFKLMGTNNFGYDPDSGQVTGRVAESLNVPEGTILKPNIVKDAFAKGNLLNPETQKPFNSLEEALGYYNGLTTSRPDQLIPTTPIVKTKAKATTKK